MIVPTAQLLSTIDDLQRIPADRVLALGVALDDLGLLF